MDFMPINRGSFGRVWLVGWQDVFRLLLGLLQGCRNLAELIGKRVAGIVGKVGILRRKKRRLQGEANSSFHLYFYFHLLLFLSFKFEYLMYNMAN